MVRRGELNRDASDAWGGSASRRDAPAREPAEVARDPSGAAREPSGDAPRPGRGQRWVYGAETGVRWSVQGLAVLLWVPLGLVFWLPFLLRRTVNYVFAVLAAGLTGGEPDRSERRWTQAVRFYQYGFLRIVHAFRTAEDADAYPWDRPGRRAATGSFPLELLWAAAFWGAVAWLVGVWPDAPADVTAAAVWVAESAAAAGRWAWDGIRGLFAG